MECPICLLEMSDKTIILNCGHEFHKKCLKQWFNKSISCPTCRFNGKKIIKTIVCCWYKWIEVHDIKIVDQDIY